MTQISLLLSQLASANRAVAAEHEAIENNREKITLGEEKLAEHFSSIDKKKELSKLNRREAQKQEAEIGSLEKKRSDASAQQAQASNNTDYATWTSRIAEHEKSISEIEESVLETLEACDTAEQEIEASVEKGTIIEKEIRNSIEDYTSSIASSQERATELDTRRNAIIVQLGGSFKGFYERLYAKYTETTVVPIKKGSCGGCYMKLTIDVVAQIRTSEDPITCKSCNRILYSLAEK